MIQPTASSSPAWVQHIVTSGVNIWSLHPVQAAAASVWIQIGMGLWLLVAPRGLWSRFGGLASVGWGLVVWVFGEAFGGIFAPGLTWLFGAPGAVLIYCVAGVLVALPDRAWATPRHRPHRPGGLRGLLHRHGGPAGLAGTWLLAGAPAGDEPRRDPGRHGGPDGPDAAAGLSRLVGVVLRPVRYGARMGRQPGRRDPPGWHWGRPLHGRRRVVLPAVIAAVVLCLADWVLVEDLGFLGGNGTDPNSMVPTALVLVAGYVAMVRLPVPIAETAPADAPSSAPSEPRPNAGAGGTG